MSIKEKVDSLRGSIDVDLLEDALGIDVINKLGDEDICRCPLPSHSGVDANPSFSLNRAKLLYNCFACGVGGSVIDLVARVLDVDYEDAYRFCKTYDDQTLGRDDPFAFGRKIESIMAREKMGMSISKPLPVYSRSVLDDWLESDTSYFSSRGINRETQKDFMLGFDPKHERAGYSGPAAIIPHFFDEKLVGYQERWTDDQRPKSIPKYTNTKGFPKAETLFGYDRAVSSRESVVVVESALTAVYLYQCNHPAVATFGAQVTDDQIKLLQSFRWGVTLSFDNDDPGRSACDTLVKRLHKTIPVHVIDSFGSEKQDLNDVPPEMVESLIKDSKPWFMRGKQNGF